MKELLLVFMNFNFNFTKTIETLKSKISRVAVRSDRDSFYLFNFSCRVDSKNESKWKHVGL